jgi:PPOX class probable F420-dependent enzyme
MASVMPPENTPFGERVARRLRDEPVIWMTTVGADGTPQPNPVWFLWDGQSFLIYSLPDAARLSHLKRNVHVALHFDGNGKGGDIVVIAGEAHVSTEDVSADKNAVYVEKYREFIRRSFQTPENFASRYNVALRVTPKKVRGF